MRLVGFFGIAAAIGTLGFGPAQARLFEDSSRIPVGGGYGEFDFAQSETTSTQGAAKVTPGTDTNSPAPPETEAPITDEDILPDLTTPSTEDDFSVGEIPVVETVELTAEGSRKALDAYVLVRDKYKDAELENYESLQDFVEQNTQGKAFEADIKSFGFADVNVWNVTISTVGFAYANEVDDQTEDIRQQIEEVKADTEMAQDMRDRMVAALSAMIPSANNKTVVEGLMADAVYLEKLKQLETEEE